MDTFEFIKLVSLISSRFKNVSFIQNLLLILLGESVWSQLQSRQRKTARTENKNHRHQKVLGKCVSHKKTSPQTN